MSGGWASAGGVLLLVLLSANLCMSSVNVVVRGRRRQGLQEQGEMVEEGEVEVPNTGEYEDDNKPSNHPDISVLILFCNVFLGNTNILNWANFYMLNQGSSELVKFA